MKIVHILEKLNIKYAAGFFDGEGCIRAVLNKNKTNAAGLHVFITNTYLPILEKFQKEFGGSVKLRNTANKKHKAQYQWRLSNRKLIEPFLKRVLPFLIEKNPQAVLALEYCKLPILRANRYSNNYDKTLIARNERIRIAKELARLKRVR